MIKGGGPGFESDLRPFATSALCPLSTTVFSNKGNFFVGGLFVWRKNKTNQTSHDFNLPKTGYIQDINKMLLLAHEHPKGRDAIQSSALCDL